ncbi:MAG: aminotransferase class V-fold PLP-dependent enzyme [Phycisphaerales bacterium]|nr:aminotransferase class V-fold PLP-dependent enzyme [Phycisphaerales bacterium]
MADFTPLDRRWFLALMGALPAARALACNVDTGVRPPGQPGARSGLAMADDLLLAPGLVYLQTGSVGPSPRPVMERTVAAWKELEQNPTRYAYRLGPPALEDVRTKAAAFLRCADDELVLTRNTTDGMNAVACGLDLAAGDRVLTTDQEHGGGRHCWDYLASRRGIVLDIVSVPPGENDAQAILDRFRRAITPRTRVLSFSHLLYTTGLRMPVVELSAMAAAHGCLSVVDGAQAAGGVDVNVTALGCDVYVTTGHKWMLGPKGTGMLCLREGARDRVPLIAEQAGRKAQSDSTGLTNIPSVLGLGAAIDYLRAFGIVQIEAHNLALRDQLFQILQGVPQVRLVSPPPGPLASPQVTVQLPDSVKCRDVAQRLSEKDQIMLRAIPDLPNGLRFSTHLFNSINDVERAVQGLRTELT